MNPSSDCPFSEKVFVQGLNTYPSGSKGQQRETQKSLVTSTFEILQWNLSLLMFIYVYLCLSILVFLFMFF